MLRIISCRQATLFVEQQADGALAPLARNSLWLHLRYCPYCSRYAKQTVLVSELARNAVRAAASAAQPGLSNEAKERLQQLLEEGERR
ncbi:hypothetical protein SAMN02745146_3550 [Hymenobacter daecheongensis DSM 21074]|uniref:Zinc-finger n=1 Tax=Hymenobacter daecheongensis DSM 21074 TaxID=1121955 RepID=A0A1M6KSE3_9BACT|nr:hypothetical protein [Hymenobacter daecheongensis]SHJ61905.1 hypothetical protein SAMN02745146_3550 [Hymenobacter daecheongensis DSM 21074]